MFRGTFIGQIIAVTGSLILAKIYGTEAYGLFGVFISLASIGSILNTLQLEKCIVTTKDISGSKQWYTWVSGIIPLMGALSFLFLILLFEFDIQLASNTFLLSLSVLGSIVLSYYATNESLFTFKKHFKVVSNAKIVVPIGTVVFQYIIFKYNPQLGLIYGYILTQLLILLYFVSKNKRAFTKPNIQFIKEEFGIQRGLVTQLLPSNMLNGIAIHIMPILLLRYFGATEAGVYFFVTKLLGTPLYLLSSSVSQVYFQKASELFHHQKSALFKLTKKVVITNGGLMLLFLILINTLGMFILDWFLDASWKNVMLYTWLLSFLIFARALFNPISSLIVIMRKHQSSLWFNGYLISCNLLAIYVGVQWSSIIYTIVLQSVLGAIGYLSLLIYFWKALKTEKHD